MTPASLTTRGARSADVNVTRPFLDAPRPITFAHRGGAALWPENTLESFRGALALGYRYIETDVHVTHDGEVVICHDAAVDRTTDGHGPIASLTLAELRRLDAGYRFERAGAFPYRGQGLGVPTLAEALGLAPELRLNIDIKPRGEDAVRALWELVDRLGAHDRILVASGHSPSLRAFRRLSRGRVATSASANEILRFWLASRAGVSRALRIGYDALQVPIHRHGLRVVDERFVRAAHARGLHVHVWTLDSPRVAAHLAELGVDGIMTDRPDLFAP